MFETSLFENLVPNFDGISSWKIVNKPANALTTCDLTYQDKIYPRWLRAGVRPSMNGTSLNTNVPGLHVNHNVVIKPAIPHN